MKRFVLVFIVFGSVDGLQITQSPQSRPNATIGDTVVFQCRLNSKSANPGWSINGTDYQITDLPLGYSYKEENYTKSLVVGPLEQQMNNTYFYCYIITFGGRYESSRAYLVIAHGPGSNRVNCSSRELDDRHKVIINKPMHITGIMIPFSKSVGTNISKTLRPTFAVPVRPTFVVTPLATMTSIQTDPCNLCTVAHMKFIIAATLGILFAVCLPFIGTTIYIFCKLLTC